MKIYGEISKTEELDDGSIKVWGYASSEAVDSDGEIITADAMKAALPDYMKWANVREMHQAKAAGTAIEAEVQDDGRTWFGAHIIDSEAVKKVKGGVYKGFSIGGKVTGRDSVNKSIISGIKLVEVSLVDRPANPEAVFTVVKAEMLDDESISAVDQLAELLNKGEISPEALLELAKGAKAEPVEEVVEKGMYSLQDFAQALTTIGWLCNDAQWESEWEGDNSPIPAQLREWLAQGLQLFRDMAAEETAELMAQIKQQAGEIDVIELAQRGHDLAKAGAKFSKDAKEKLAKAHQAVKDASYHLDGLGYDKADDSDEDKEKSALADDLAKASGDLDLVKADLVKVAEERDALRKRVSELEAQPAPGKALLKAIAKGEDVSADQAEKSAQPDQNDPLALIKAIHAQGGARLY